MEPKAKSLTQKKIDELLNTASVLEKLDATLDTGVSIYLSGNEIALYPQGEAQARLLVGKLIRLYKIKPAICKPYTSATTLNATFKQGDINVVVKSYKGKKCAIVKRTIVHEATPEQIVPAKEAYTEEIEELVCDLPSVEAEVEAPAAAAVAEEVPF